MSREDFIAAHKHVFQGLLYDAITMRRKGGDLSLWMEAAGAEICNQLAKMYDELTLKLPAEANGRLPISPVKR